MSQTKRQKKWIDRNRKRKEKREYRYKFDYLQQSVDRNAFGYGEIITFPIASSDYCVWEQIFEFMFQVIAENGKSLEYDPELACRELAFFDTLLNVIEESFLDHPESSCILFKVGEYPLILSAVEIWGHVQKNNLEEFLFKRSEVCMAQLKVAIKPYQELVDQLDELMWLSNHVSREVFIPDSCIL